MHAPLIVRAPGYLQGRSTPALTEFIDIYPSLCELAGLPLPVHLQGRSFVPLLMEPDLKWKSAAIGRYKNGDTIRTHQFRFTQYWSRELKKSGRMLYDHSVDGAENVNLSESPEHRATVDAHIKQLLFDMGHPNP